jgi:prepilin-type N-terminal cleavage/methylation domain-containing protein/prepilin-type processing-associated H-X9-DG protein
MTRQRTRGFTLVELLVVIGIIALLISILLPALNRARDQGNIVKCASNMRQLALALVNYASENKGKYPPNLNAGGLGPGNPATAQLWYDADRLGKYLPKTVVTGSNSIATPVMVCPTSKDGTVRSYAMNIWASGAVDKSVPTQKISGSSTINRGSMFGAKSKESSLTILLAERHVNVDGGTLGLFTQATVGFQGDLPGERFLGITKPSVYDVGVTLAGQGANTELDYTRHRQAKDRNAGLAARGRTNIAFADGHVSLLSHDELANVQTKKSRFVALWSQQDRVIEGQ